MSDDPTTKQFRIGELKDIIADHDALVTRIREHKWYLSNPTLQEAHRADCRDNDVVISNLNLALDYHNSAKAQLGIALKLTDTPEPIVETPASEQPDPETP